jgi:hypothetical protein
MGAVSHAEKIRRLIHQESGKEGVTNSNEHRILRSPLLTAEVAKLSKSDLQLTLKQMAVSSVRERQRTERVMNFILEKSEDPADVIDFLEQVLQERWGDFEMALLAMGRTDWQVLYADKVIKGPWAEAEKNVLRKKAWGEGVFYAAEVLEDRWETLERMLLKECAFKCAVMYAAFVIGGRWPDLEKRFIRKSDKTTCGDLYEYAKRVIKGRLPEDLHNLMIMKGMMEGNSDGFQRYTKAKKYQ